MIKEKAILSRTRYYVEEGFPFLCMGRGKKRKFKQLWLEGKTFKYIAAFLLQQKARIHMKLIYRRCGDYFLPNIGIPAEDTIPLGKYGRMRLQYLREHRPLLFNQLLLSGKLMPHLYSIDKVCQERMEFLIPQMKDSEGVTEKLKATDQMEWTRRMNSIHHRMEETLFNELVYS